MSAAPHILQDRTDFSQIADEHPELASELRSTRIGVKAGRSALQFCGLAGVSEERSFVFLPRKSYTGIAERDLITARLTMRALARFGRDMTDRLGVATGGEGDTGRLAVVADLAKDFLLYGIFSERSRHRSRTSGKPDWPRTVIREQSYVGSDGSVVYEDIRTTRTKDSHDSLLAQIQAAVLLEIARQHGWWIDGLIGRQDELKRYSQPRLPRTLWATHLRLLLPELYASRAIFLANGLISYLVNDSATRAGETYYGVEDFHTVWEHMLRQVLRGVEAGWNSRLPRPAYRRNDGGLSVQDRGLQTDIVLRDSSGTLHVVDAKYYDATYLGNAPGLPDIIKQFFYDIALSSVASGEAVKGCFVFPSRMGETAIFTTVEMYHRDGSIASGFPSIECHYLDMVSVLRAYTEGQKIALFSP
ncbi:LlaJI family restriction endonuclease [Sedimentitalea arenosa]|uniref:LlaJI family restriction endonuclease n=1 Tax=Sedimentitalea arenosa TaxID=2798803 RepID=A0A8J7IQH4_9RHOB|nr:LlaJI family restriction endonuclease [Arenibacterium arenosum]MBJ6371791.1 LlaJI family restriction endonuclease [Arenibacterium arenosum]